MDFGIFLGALLGFLSGLSVDRILRIRDRRERGQLWRSTLARELVDNLAKLAGMDRSTRATRDSGYQTKRTAIDKPRGSIFHAVSSSAEALLSLTRVEQINVVELSVRLDRLLHEYDLWPSRIGDEKGTLVSQSAGGQNVLQRDVSTEELLTTIHDLMLVHIMTLVPILNGSREGNLGQPVLRAVREALSPTRSRLPWKAVHPMFAVETPPIDQLRKEELSKPFVVWEHHQPDFPVPVIELHRVFNEWQNST